MKRIMLTLRVQGVTVGFGADLGGDIHFALRDKDNAVVKLRTNKFGKGLWIGHKQIAKAKEFNASTIGGSWASVVTELKAVLSQKGVL
jgi:hypothetical protein